MSVGIHAITIDCRDHEAVGRFWAEALGWGDDPENPNSAGDPEWLLVAPDGSTHLLFQQVAEIKITKNRMHFDLEPEDDTRDTTVERLQGLGATIIGDHRKPDGSGWVTMADIEANEFCVLRNAAERSG